MRTLTCERCKAIFLCSRDSNICWCTTKPYIRLDITESYKDCLCEKCLEEIHNETSKNNNQR